MCKIKICGIRREEDIAYVNECKPDYIGFVFAAGKRQVSREEAVKLRARLNEGIKVVGVFVNEDIHIVAKFLNEGIVDLAQLHGDETLEYISKLRLLMKRGKLIKAVRVASSQDIAYAKGLDVDYLLFDAYSREAYGGTGRTFDWSFINNVDKPFFLAGGITSDNVALAMQTVKPYAIDVSSSVEAAGYKEKEKIFDMVRRVRGGII